MYIEFLLFFDIARGVLNLSEEEEEETVGKSLQIRGKCRRTDGPPSARLAGYDVACFKIQFCL